MLRPKLVLLLTEIFQFWIFVSASHLTGLDTRSMTRRSIIVGVMGRERSGTSRGSSPAGLCCSSAHFIQCGPDEPSWTWTQIWVQPRMPDYSLNWKARSSAIQGWQRCQWCSPPTRRWPSRSRRPFGLKSAQEHWPSGTDARQSAEKPLHKAEIFQYWPCLRNMTSFIPPRYRKSHGTSHYTTSPRPKNNFFYYVRWTSYFCLWIYFHSSRRSTFSFARTILLYWWGPRYLKHVINDGHVFFNSFLCVWGISSFHLINMSTDLPSLMFYYVHHITNSFFYNAL